MGRSYTPQAETELLTDDAGEGDGAECRGHIRTHDPGAFLNPSYVVNPLLPQTLSIRV